MSTAIATMDMLSLETNGEDLPPSPPADSLIDAPSGFILKLFQMITDAEDDLVKWTSKGDAFIIGSNIKRLEAETLPQFFRHNRFQSLVRQLNFYSFRKVNKERNIWIYKHELFHRDRPEDLYKVRRRTCPGLDGRKQRFNRYSTRRLNGDGSDDSSDESSMTDENGQTLLQRKHLMEEAPMSVLNTKRPRRLSNESEPESHANLDNIDVDRSLVMEEILPEESEGAEEPASFSTDLLTVSEVSDRLEAYARKARVLSSSSSRGGRRSGVVTPPYDPSSVGLVTYDDECNYDSDDHLLDESIPPLRLSIAASDFDESFPFDDVDPISDTSPPKTKQPPSPPVKESSSAASIMQQILGRIPDERQQDFVALTTVARFCMSTSPSEDSDLSSLVLHLIATSEELSREFQLYRSALDPSAGASSMQRLWQHEAARGVALRDFKTFAVNCIQTLLESPYLVADEKVALELTTELWSKSVGVGV